MKSYLIFILMIAICLGGTVTSCKKEPKERFSLINKQGRDGRNGVRQGRQSASPQRQSSGIVAVCPQCGGTGKNKSTDVFESQMVCWACNGEGRVAQERYNQVAPRDYAPVDCKACNGTGLCSTCIGYDRSPRNCGVCHHTGRCSGCGGRGYVKPGM